MYFPLFLGAALAGQIREAGARHALLPSARPAQVRPLVRTAQSAQRASRSVLAVSLQGQHASRLDVRAELLDLLAGPAPQAVSGRVEELVRELELLENVPATSDFLLLGLAGNWSLRAHAVPDAQAETVGAPELQVLEVRQRVDAGALEAASSARFREPGGAEATLTVAADLTANADLTGREDTVQFRTTGRGLVLHRGAIEPGSVPGMLQALHAELPCDFRGDDGVRLSLQTTYLDEVLRVTRCTTRDLAGAVSVHVREPA